MSVIQKIRSLLSKSLISFQILSDLHPKVCRQCSSFEIPVSAWYLVLASDVGRLVDYDDYLSFLRRQTERFERGFLVLGNHEFYGASFVTGLEKARKLEKESSLNGKFVLHQTRYDIPNSHVTILGCTLWSSITEEAKDVVK